MHTAASWELRGRGRFMFFYMDKELAGFTIFTLHKCLKYTRRVEHCPVREHNDCGRGLSLCLAVLALCSALHTSDSSLAWADRSFICAVSLT